MNRDVGTHMSKALLRWETARAPFDTFYHAAASTALPRSAPYETERGGFHVQYDLKQSEAYPYL